jgi:hypothetical protein
MLVATTFTLLLFCQQDVKLYSVDFVHNLTLLIVFFLLIFETLNFTKKLDKLKFSTSSKILVYKILIV